MSKSFDKRNALRTRPTRFHGLSLTARAAGKVFCCAFMPALSGCPTPPASGDGDQSSVPGISDFSVEITSSQGALLQFNGLARNSSTLEVTVTGPDGVNPGFLANWSIQVPDSVRTPSVLAFGFAGASQAASGASAEVRVIAAPASAIEQEVTATVTLDDGTVLPTATMIITINPDVVVEITSTESILQFNELDFSTNFRRSTTLGAIVAGSVLPTPFTVNWHIQPPAGGASVLSFVIGGGEATQSTTGQTVQVTVIAAPQDTIEQTVIASVTLEDGGVLSDATLVLTVVPDPGPTVSNPNSLGTSPVGLVASCQLVFDAGVSGETDRSWSSVTEMKGGTR